MQTISNFCVLQRGLSRPLIGEIAGQKYLFKSKGADPAREILANSLMQQVGILVPEISYADFLLEGKVQAFLQVEFLSGALALDELFMEVCKGEQSRIFAYFHLQHFQKIQLMDILIGNMDRSSKNLLIHDQKLYAIDHSKAFLPELGFNGQMPIAEVFRIIICNPLGLYILKDFEQYKATYEHFLTEVEQLFDSEVVKKALEKVEHWWDEKERKQVEETLLLRSALLRKRFFEFMEIIEENSEQFKKLVQLLERNDLISYDKLTECLESISKG